MTDKLPTDYQRGLLMKKTLAAIAIGMTAFAFVSGTAAAAPKSTSVILIDEANFAGDAVAEGLAGKGCQNVSQDDMATSLELFGGPITLWSERNCKGEKLVVTGDVADLGEFGFDNKTSSIFMG
ncbi:beta/gamma crystallin family protein [Lentzea tibetensis]|uniref:Beta/gamma crystallin family protein n=2 Tax=Lentzea tibetensis TaxID=2591470 RepID=A0A563ETZ8_9PSEU|nr:beta/gamma crystallin family protein [Lentzea tibetensis]